jgi:hypothetical protein
VIATNNRAAGAKSAIAIVINKAVAANKVAVSKAANDRLCAFD